MVAQKNSSNGAFDNLPIFCFEDMETAFSGGSEDNNDTQLDSATTNLNVPIHQMDIHLSKEGPRNSGIFSSITNEIDEIFSFNPSAIVTQNNSPTCDISMPQEHEDCCPSDGLFNLEEYLSYDSIFSQIDGEDGNFLSTTAQETDPFTCDTLLSQKKECSLTHNTFSNITGERDDLSSPMQLQQESTTTNNEESSAITPESTIQKSSFNEECTFSRITDEGSNSASNNTLFSHPINDIVILKDHTDNLLKDLSSKNVNISKDFALFLLHDLFRENNISLSSSSKDLISIQTIFTKDMMISIQSQQSLIIQHIIHFLRTHVKLNHISKKSALFMLSEIVKMPKQSRKWNAKCVRKILFSRINLLLHEQNISQEKLLYERRKCIRSQLTAKNRMREKEADYYEKCIEILEKMIHYLNFEEDLLTNNSITISQDIIYFLSNDLLHANSASSSEDLIETQKISAQNLLIRHIIHNLILQNQTNDLTIISKKSALFILSEIVSPWKWNTQNNILQSRVNKILRYNSSQDGEMFLLIKNQCISSKHYNAINNQSISDRYTKLINFIEKVVYYYNNHHTVPHNEILTFENSAPSIVEDFCDIEISQDCVNFLSHDLFHQNGECSITIQEIFNQNLPLMQQIIRALLENDHAMQTSASISTKSALCILNTISTIQTKIHTLKWKKMLNSSWEKLKKLLRLQNSSYQATKEMLEKIRTNCSLSQCYIQREYSNNTSAHPAKYLINYYTQFLNFICKMENYYQKAHNAACHQHDVL